MKLIATFTLIWAAVSAAAASSDPGETALRFLEKIRSGEVNLKPGADTALSVQTGEAKRQEIARRLERMARDLGEDPLEVGAVKLDGDLAAVLVRKINSFDPNRMQVFPIALVKRGEGWAAAPVPASFENSGIGYAAVLRARLKALEDWMLREQVLDLAVLRDESAERMRRKIERQLSVAELRALDARQAADRFLEACQKRNLPEMFGLLGGLDSNMPTDWPLRVKAAERAVAAGPDDTYPWRLLISRDVLRTTVYFDDDARSPLVSIACLDPAGNVPPGTRPRVRLVHLELTKSRDGLWRIDPPGYFLQETEDADDGSDQDLDSDLLDVFPEKIAEVHPALPQPTADDARRAVVAALHDGDFSALIRLIPLDGDPADAREACVRAASLWWTFREPFSVRRAVPLSMNERDDKAAAAFQFFSARNPDRLDFNVLYFEKSAGGWLWIPGSGPELERSFRDWASLQGEKSQEDWRDLLLADCPVLEEIPEDAAPSEGESRRLVESWFRELRAGNFSAALRLTARLSLPDSQATLLRNFGYELSAIRRNPEPQAIAGVHRSGGWCGVGASLDSDGKPGFPLYPVVGTPSGPRILVEIDLAESGMRSRDFLNKTTMKRLAAFSPSAADSLKEIFLRHQTAVTGAAHP